MPKRYAILATADLLLDARHIEDIRSSHLSHDNLRRTDPGLAITALSWFAEHGPYRSWQATKSTIRSLIGIVKQVGPIEGPPLLPREGQTAIITALAAFIDRRRSLQPRARSTTLFRQRSGNVAADFRLRSLSRAGTRLFAQAQWRQRLQPQLPVACSRTKEGWLGVTVVTIQQWRASPG